jgi:hypothetical protein
VAEDAGSQQIADAIGAMWADIESALQPVLGRRGVAALFKRTLYLAATRYPWLAPLNAGPADAAADVAGLTTLFAAQQPAIAMEAGGALFMIFRELLTTLIGAQLSERLPSAPSCSLRTPAAMRTTTCSAPCSSSAC